MRLSRVTTLQTSLTTESGRIAYREPIHCQKWLSISRWTGNLTTDSIALAGNGAGGLACGGAVRDAEGAVGYGGRAGRRRFVRIKAKRDRRGHRRNRCSATEILELTRWMGKYYCCPVELCVKWLARSRAQGKDQLEGTAIRQARQEFMEQLAKLRRTRRSRGVFQRSPRACRVELVQRADTTDATIKSLAAKGFIVLSDEVDERDPFGGEVFLPTDRWR